MFPVPEGIVRINSCRPGIHPKIQIPDCKALILEHQMLLIKTAEVAFPTSPICTAQGLH